jgi:hypothetical protein
VRSATPRPSVDTSAVALCAAPAGTTFYGSVEVDGVLGEVFLGDGRAVVLAADTCTVLAEVPLP